MARKTKAEAAQTRQEIINAARCVFHQCGVSRTSMENVARAAGVSRGAIYWHFENKAALFFAMREQTTSVLDQVHVLLLSPDIANPLDAIERSLCALFVMLESNPVVRQTFEIMSLRCEYVDEFVPVLQEVLRPNVDFLACLRARYQQAGEMGFLRPGLDAEALAYDTLAFTTGLFKNWLASLPDDDWRNQVQHRIGVHVNLRRAG